MSTTSIRLAGSAVLAVGVSLALVAPAGAVGEGETSEIADLTSTEEEAAPAGSEPGMAEAAGHRIAATLDAVIGNAPISAADAHETDEPPTDEEPPLVDPYDLGYDLGAAAAGDEGYQDGYEDGDSPSAENAGYNAARGGDTTVPQDQQPPGEPQPRSCDPGDPPTDVVPAEQFELFDQGYDDGYLDACDANYRDGYAEGYADAYQRGIDTYLAEQEDDEDEETPPVEPPPGDGNGGDTGSNDDLGRPSNPTPDTGRGQTVQQPIQSGLSRQRTPAVRAESRLPAERVRVQRASTASAPAQLPRTGSDTGEIAFLGTLLVGGGVVLLTVSRPRRRGAHRA